MWAALWSRIQGWLWMAGAVLAVLVGAYAAGGRAARRSTQIEQARSEKKALEKARHVENETAAMDDSAIADDLKSRWVRRPKG